MANSREEAEQLAVDLVRDEAEVGRVGQEVELVGLDDEHPPLVLLRDEVFVAAVEALEVAQRHLLLVASSALLDVAREVAHGAAEIDHEVGVANYVGHVLKQFHVGLEVAVVEVAEIVVVGREDIDALVDGSVLHDVLLLLLELQQVLEPLLEVEDLQRERPPLDVAIVVLEVWVVGYLLVVGLPSVVAGEEPRERRFSRSDIAGYGYVHEILMSWWLI